jgi:hypothetical protein
MCNKKVYLAKSNLASGLDVEYVKSNLSRIEGIDIVEYGMGVSPSACAALVIVTKTDDLLDSDEICVNKHIATILDEFLQNEDENMEEPGDHVYIYAGKGSSAGTSDIEKSTPLAVMFINFWEVEEEDASFDKHTVIEYDNDSTELLSHISTDIDAPFNRWKKVSRHYQPEPEFAVPKLEDLNKWKCAVPIHKHEEKAKPANVESFQGDLRMLLIGRMK